MNEIVDERAAIEAVTKFSEEAAEIASKALQEAEVAAIDAADARAAALDAARLADLRKAAIGLIRDALEEAEKAAEPIVKAAKAAKVAENEAMEAYEMTIDAAKGAATYAEWIKNDLTLATKSPRDFAHRAASMSEVYVQDAKLCEAKAAKAAAAASKAAQEAVIAAESTN